MQAPGLLVLKLSDKNVPHSFRRRHRRWNKAGSIIPPDQIKSRFACCIAIVLAKSDISSSLHQDCVCDRTKWSNVNLGGQA